MKGTWQTMRMKINPNQRTFKITRPAKKPADRLAIFEGLTLPQPHAKQEEIVYSEYKNIIVCTGRQFGKTTSAVIRSIRNFVLYGKDVLYLAPTDAQLSEFWNNVTGVLAKHKDVHWSYRESPRKEIKWLDGTGTIRLFSATNSKYRRGMNCHEAILDEYQDIGGDVFESVVAPMLMRRDGTAIFIFTPPNTSAGTSSTREDRRHSINFFNKHLEDKDWQYVRATSWDNPHLPRNGIKRMSEGMTDLTYRREIMAELLDFDEAAYWRSEYINSTEPPPLSELDIVIGVDPSVTSTDRSDATGIIIAGMDSNGIVHVLEDATQMKATPMEWTKVVGEKFVEYNARFVCVEVNQGRDLVTEALLRAEVAGIDKNTYRKRIKGQIAVTGKGMRAQPISILYGKGEVFHATGAKLDELEQEMLNWNIGATWSPNRLDALVWAVAELKGITFRKIPKVRTIY